MVPVIVFFFVMLGIVVIFAIPSIGVILAMRDRAKRFRELPTSFAYVTDGGPADDVVDDAILDFIDEWHRAMGGGAQKLIDAFDGLYVNWHPGEGFTHPKWPGRIFSGLTSAINEIHVAIADGQSIGETAFFHELVHVALWIFFGEPDPNHDNPERFNTWKPEHDELIARLKLRWS